MADASRIAVVSSLALKGVLEELKPAFERSLAARLEPRFDATQAILGQVGSLRADLLVRQGAHVRQQIHWDAEVPAAVQVAEAILRA